MAINTIKRLAVRIKLRNAVIEGSRASCKADNLINILFAGNQQKVEA